MTEDKIREAYLLAKKKRRDMGEENKGAFGLWLFTEGYLAMLNSLVPRYHIAANEMMYQLPEGVSRNE